MKHNIAIHAEWPMSVTITFMFLPWIAVVLFTAGPWAALNFLGYAIVVIAVGYSVVSVALPASARTQSIFLVPALGILAISALTAFWLRLGLPLTWVLALWLGLMAAGAVSLWSDRVLWAKSSVGYGGALVLLSVLICAVFFLPGARNDAVMHVATGASIGFTGTRNTSTRSLRASRTAMALRNHPAHRLKNFDTILDPMHLPRPFPALTDLNWAMPSLASRAAHRSGHWCSRASDWARSYRSKPTAENSAESCLSPAFFSTVHCCPCSLTS